MTMDLGDITKESIQQLWDEIVKRHPHKSIAESSDRNVNFSSVEEAIQYYKSHGAVTLEEYENWAKETFGL